MDEQRARELLERERDRLRGLHEQADTHLSESHEDSTSELTTFDQHPADVGTETLEREQDESVREHAASELDEVEAALERLEQGTYGRCEVCGGEIGDDRLEAMPQTRYCIEDQRQRERDQDVARQSRT
jgi:DnaK suppressor protein